jgi:predicted Zn-dependent peptidase
MPRGSRTHADGYQCATLANGLGLVVKPMPQAQSVSVGIWVRAGGRYEPAAKAGISHFLEHLLFKGTTRRSCEQLKQAIEGVGGSLNGFTAEEFTCYLAKVPARHARRAIDILADMVRSPRFAPADIEKEREVILEQWDVISVPPGVMRGFRNAGTEESVLLAILGGSDSGHVTWSPKVLRCIQQHSRCWYQNSG